MSRTEHSAAQNTATFFERLQACVHPGLPADELPPDWWAFRRICEQREADGVERWGYDEDQYLTRDNAAEGFDEATDGTNYALFEFRRAIARYPDADPDEALQLALIAGKAFYEGFAALVELQRIMPSP